MEDEIWTTKDGRKIAVGDMDETHVRNALRLVLRRRRAQGTLHHLAETDETFYDELYNEVMSDRMWGSD